MKTAFTLYYIRYRKAAAMGTAMPASSDSEEIESHDHHFIPGTSAGNNSEKSFAVNIFRFAGFPVFADTFEFDLPYIEFKGNKFKFCQKREGNGGSERLDDIAPGVLKLLDIEALGVFRRKILNEGFGVIIHESDNDFTGDLVFESGRFALTFFRGEFTNCCTAGKNTGQK